jgi:hypothetical protein
MLDVVIVSSLEMNIVYRCNTTPMSIVPNARCIKNKKRHVSPSLFIKSLRRNDNVLTTCAPYLDNTKRLAIRDHI